MVHVTHLIPTTTSISPSLSNSTTTIMEDEPFDPEDGYEEYEKEAAQRIAREQQNARKAELMALLDSEFGGDEEDVMTFDSEHQPPPTNTNNFPDSDDEYHGTPTEKERVLKIVRQSGGLVHENSGALQWNGGEHSLYNAQVHQPLHNVHQRDDNFYQPTQDLDQVEQPKQQGLHQPSPFVSPQLRQSDDRLHKPVKGEADSESEYNSKTGSRAQSQGPSRNAAYRALKRELDKASEEKRLPNQGKISRVWEELGFFPPTLQLEINSLTKKLNRHKKATQKISIDTSRPAYLPDPADLLPRRVMSQRPARPNPQAPSQFPALSNSNMAQSVTKVSNMEREVYFRAADVVCVANKMEQLLHRIGYYLLNETVQTRGSHDIMREIAHVLDHHDIALQHGRKLFLNNKYDTTPHLCVPTTMEDRTKVSEWAAEYLLNAKDKACEMTNLRAASAGGNVGKFGNPQGAEPVPPLPVAWNELILMGVTQREKDNILSQRRVQGLPTAADNPFQAGKIMNVHGDTLYQDDTDTVDLTQLDGPDLTEEDRQGLIDQIRELNPYAWMSTIRNEQGEIETIVPQAPGADVPQHEISNLATLLNAVTTITPGPEPGDWEIVRDRIRNEPGFAALPDMLLPLPKPQPVPSQQLHHLYTTPVDNTSQPITAPATTQEPAQSVLQPSPQYHQALMTQRHTLPPKPQTPFASQPATPTLAQGSPGQHQGVYQQQPDMFQMQQPGANWMNYSTPQPPPPGYQQQPPPPFGYAAPQGFTPQGFSQPPGYNVPYPMQPYGQPPYPAQPQPYQWSYDQQQHQQDGGERMSKRPRSE
jgi:hypothetical protein